LQIAPLVQARIDTLAKLANQGSLTDADRAEYEALINAADFISILKVKARQQLNSSILKRMDAAARELVRRRPSAGGPD
jgi:hypothetical protein